MRVIIPASTEPTEDLAAPADPARLPEALRIAGPALQAAGETHAKDLLSLLHRAGDSMELARRLNIVVDEIVRTGAADLYVEWSTRITPFLDESRPEGRISLAGVAHVGQLAALRSVAQHETQDVLRPAYMEALLNRDSRPAGVAPEACPSLFSAVQRLGFSADTAREILTSWLFHDPAKAYRGRDIRPDAVAGEAHQWSFRHAYRVADQLCAMVTFAYRYGDEALHKLVAPPFNLHNFARYSEHLDFLHDQLVRWEFGTQPVGTVYTGAHTDWALNVVGRDGVGAIHIAGDECLVTEAETPADLGRLAVAVGARERRLGRDPENDDLVELVIIEGHADPEGITLGATGEITVEQYQEAEGLHLQRGFSNARPNTYAQHYGRAYDQIWAGCNSGSENTAVTGEPRKNLAESATHHGGRSQGVPDFGEGLHQIELDGTATFRIPGGLRVATAYGLPRERRAANSPAPGGNALSK